MILLISDKPELDFSLFNLLTSNGFDVDMANSRDEVLLKILCNTYALIVVDIHDSEDESSLVLNDLLDFDKSKDIPIVVLAFENNLAHNIFDCFGTIDYMLKPVDSRALLFKIKLMYKLYQQNVQLIEAQKALQNEIYFRKKVQIELKNRVKYLHTILESLPQIAFKANANGDITFVNNQWYKYALTTDEFPEQHPSFEPIKKQWQASIDTNTPFEYEVRIKHLETNKYRYHLLRIIPVVKNNAIIKWIGTFTDIEAQKQIENKKDEFMSIASHELKIPLTSIKSYIQLMNRLSYAEDNIKVLSFGEKAFSQVLKLEDLISNLLDVSKINNGNLQMQSGIVDLEALISNVVSTVNDNYNSQGIHLYRFGNKITNKVLGDPYRIEQVIVNLLSNAMKYSPGSDRIVLHTEMDADKVTIIVEDFGIGISEEQQKLVFNKFYRVKESSLSFQGLGIGLYICSEIIKQHNGSYSISSVLGEGTKVQFTLPVI